MQITKTVRFIAIFFVFFQVFDGKAQDGFIIRNATVFDGEKVTKNTDIAVENGLIANIGKSIKKKKSFEIDGTGKFLMPTLSNTHVHAWAAASFQESAKAGVLNMMDMAGMEAYQPMMRNLKDSTNYANYYFAGYAATAPEGHGTQFGFPVPTLSKPEDAEAFVKARIAAKVDYIKIIIEPARATLDSATIKSLIDEAHKNSLMAVAHVSRVADAKMAIQNGIDGLVHIWRDEQITDEDLEALIEENNFFIIPTLLTTFLAIESRLSKNPDAKVWSKEILLDEVKLLYDAKIPILTGTDPPNLGINYGTDLYKEMQLLSEAGIPNIEVLKAATSNPAKYFKLDKTGYLKKGYRADMLLVNGNPLKDMQEIKKLEIVWKKGNKVNIEEN